jgi:hypothetical protein
MGSSRLAFDPAYLATVARILVRSRARVTRLSRPTAPEPPGAPRG